MDLKDLMAKTDRLKENKNARRRGLYSYARSHGFSVKEAMVLCNTSIDTINKIFIEKGASSERA